MRCFIFQKQHHRQRRHLIAGRGVLYRHGAVGIQEGHVPQTPAVLRPALLHTGTETSRSANEQMYDMCRSRVNESVPTKSSNSGNLSS